MKLIYSDPDIVVVDKPGGLLSVPGRGPDKQDCVVNRIKKRFPECIDQPAVHRLDMYTSGLLVLALSQEAHKNLSLQFGNRLVKKVYIAVLDGELTDSSGEIQLPFRLDPYNRPIQIYDPIHGKLGITIWQKLNNDGRMTRVQFIPETGRTHQLRVHAAHPFGLNCPIVGDSLYGNGKEGEQMMLHAFMLTFQHPTTEEKMEFSSEVPF